MIWYLPVYSVNCGPCGAMTTLLEPVLPYFGRLKKSLHTPALPCCLWGEVWFRLVLNTQARLA